MDAKEFISTDGNKRVIEYLRTSKDDDWIVLGILCRLLDEYKNQSFWNPIDPDNLPEGEVLAACFDKNHPYHKEKLIGNIEFCENSFMCDNDETTIFNVTHYHDINKHDLK